MAAKSFNAFLMAQSQFDKVADILDLDEATRELLRSPMREYHFSIPVSSTTAVRRFSAAIASSITTPGVRAKAASVFIRKRPSIRCARWRCG